MFIIHYMTVQETPIITILLRKRNSINRTNYQSIKYLIYDSAKDSWYYSTALTGKYPYILYIYCETIDMPGMISVYLAMATKVIH